MTTRRGFLGGLAGVLAAGFAPAAIGSGVLMPVRKIAVPGIDLATIARIKRQLMENRGDTMIYRVWTPDKDAPGGLVVRDERLTLSEVQARGLPEAGFTRVPGYRRYIP